MIRVWRPTPVRLKATTAIPCLGAGRSFYNAVWIHARAASVRLGDRDLLQSMVNERHGEEPRFPAPIAEIFKQWVNPESPLHPLSADTVARIAVDSFIAELLSYRGDPDAS